MKDNYLKVILNLFKVLKKYHILSTEYLEIKNSSLAYNHTLGKLLTINSKSILLNGYDLNQDLSKKLDGYTDTKNLDNLGNFIKDNISYIQKLNHFGFSYICDNLAYEIDKYKKLFKNTKFRIYSERSTSKGSVWLFIGNINYPSCPMIELVLQEGTRSWDYIWTPHIQIDLNTSFTEQDLNKNIKKYFSIKPSHVWELRFPKRGLVLRTYSLAKVNGVVIHFGLGTNIRFPYHFKYLEDISSV